MAFIEVYFPDNHVEHFELNKNLMKVGRSSQADITVDLPGISRIHAQIEKINKTRWLITDLDSRNKTYVEGHSIKSHLLTHKDVFHFASVKVVFKDPSGASDEKIDQTAFRKIPKKNICPRCKAGMPDHAVVCVSCGYNTRTGKCLKMKVDGSPDSKNVYADRAVDAKIEDDTDSENGDTPNKWFKRPIFIIIAIFLIIALVLFTIIL